eukprot:gb/GECH01014263.1/.p1 GENE.gb/GECH01014263.1/~~gb/GECH01014263.1/.p1  ORF type:complete len:241 (+),score=54.20 gb/GECH01014263.1/:1-723(+)
MNLAPRTTKSFNKVSKNLVTPNSNVGRPSTFLTQSKFTPHNHQLVISPSIRTINTSSILSKNKSLLALKQNQLIYNNATTNTLIKSKSKIGNNLISHQSHRFSTPSFSNKDEEEEAHKYMNEVESKKSNESEETINKRKEVGTTKADMAIMFTCSVCETRSQKAFTKRAYENGVVIVRCGGCESLHLIADNLGWFSPDGSINVEKIAEQSNGKLKLKKITKDIDISLEELQKLDSETVIE